MRCDGMRSYFSCETTNWIENLTFSKADSKNPKKLCQLVELIPPFEKIIYLHLGLVAMNYKSAYI